MAGCRRWSLNAMERLKAAGIPTIPITGRPAGWCDHIARMWPVEGLVGENGAFYFRYDESQKKMLRRYFKSGEQRAADRRRLENLKQQILQKIPGCRVSADQAYREADLAIDYCEDIQRLPQKDIDAIVACFAGAGARAKVSSIHVNGWFGDYDKLTMTGILFEEAFDRRLADIKNRLSIPEIRPMMDPCLPTSRILSVWPMSRILKVKWTAIPPGWWRRREDMDLPRWWTFFWPDPAPALPMRSISSKSAPESIASRAQAHPFIHAPNITLISMSLPVLLSLIAEPLTGLVDTAFISRLGCYFAGGLGGRHRRIVGHLLDF